MPLNKDELQVRIEAHLSQADQYLERWAEFTSNASVMLVRVAESAGEDVLIETGLSTVKIERNLLRMARTERWRAARLQKKYKKLADRDLVLERRFISPTLGQHLLDPQ